MSESDAESMPDAVERFIERAESVFDDYDDGYVDPDAALSQLGDHIIELRDSYEERG